MDPVFGGRRGTVTPEQAEQEVATLLSSFAVALLRGAKEHAAGREILGGAPRSELLEAATVAREHFGHAPDPVDAAITAATAPLVPAPAEIRGPTIVAPRALSAQEASAKLRVGNGIAPAAAARALPPAMLAGPRPRRERRAWQFAAEFEEIATEALLMAAGFRAARSCEKNPFDQLAQRRCERAVQALRERDLTAWPCDRPLDRPRRIAGERMYELLAQSAHVLAEALRRVPEPYDDRPDRFRGPARETLEAAVQAAAEAQCMVRSFALAISLPKQAQTSSHWARCAVQDEAFGLLRQVCTDKGAGYAIFSDLLHESAARHFGLRERRALRHRLDALRRRLDPDFDAAVPFGGAIAEPDDDEAMLEAAVHDRAELSDFDTVAEAVDRARDELAELGSPVVVAESAVRSAEDSPFHRPDDVFEFLMALHRLSVQWRTRGGALGQSWDAALRAAGYGEKRLSDTARTRFRRHYELSWEGSRRLFEAHWTFGSRDANHCLSVHWWRDDEHRRVVVGWIGRHLPNTLS
ncbi:MAG: hypothetical protein U0625_08210 [Phycisphaerales bacterium]